MCGQGLHMRGGHSDSGAEHGWKGRRTALAPFSMLVGTWRLTGGGSVCFVAAIFEIAVGWDSGPE